jgi:3-methyladenine DNA glycosylase AlkC
MEIVQTERDKYNISLEKMRNRFDIYNRRKLELILDDDIGMNEEIVLPYNRFLD